MNKTYQRWTAGLLMSLLGAVLWAVFAFGAGQSNSEYTIARDVFGASGRPSNSEGYLHVGTLDQIAVGPSSNSEYNLHSGFWHGRTYVLTVVIAGTAEGRGIVKDCLAATECPGTRIHCGKDGPDSVATKCTAVYQEGEQVLLKAFPVGWDAFMGWFIDGKQETGAIYIKENLTITAVFDYTC